MGWDVQVEQSQGTGALYRYTGPYTRGPGPGIRTGGPCMARFNLSWVSVTWGPACGQNGRQTNVTESITFPKLCWRTVKILEGIIRFYRGIDVPVLDLLRCLCLL